MIHHDPSTQEVCWSKNWLGSAELIADKIDKCMFSAELSFSTKHLWNRVHHPITRVQKINVALFQERKGRTCLIPWYTIIWHNIPHDDSPFHHSLSTTWTYQAANLFLLPRRWQFGSPVNMAASPRPGDSLPRSNFECPPLYLTWKIRQWTKSIPRMRGLDFVGKDWQEFLDRIRPK